MFTFVPMSHKPTTYQVLLEEKEVGVIKTENLPSEVSILYFPVLSKVTLSFFQNAQLLNEIKNRFAISEKTRIVL